MDKYALGLQGEILAAKHLESLGYKIIDKNVNFPGVGELDLVCVDGKSLVFVEVRTRSDNVFGDPLESVTPQKIRKIVAASRRYLQKHNERYEGYRYDVIGIINENVTHIRDAFWAHW